MDETISCSQGELLAALRNGVDVCARRVEARTEARQASGQQLTSLSATFVVVSYLVSVHNLRYRVLSVLCLSPQ